MKFGTVKIVSSSSITGHPRLHHAPCLPRESSKTIIELVGAATDIGTVDLEFVLQ